MVTKRLIVVLLLTSWGAPAFWGNCQEPVYGGTLVYGLSITVPTLDPGVAVGTPGQTIRKLIWETLVDRDPTGRVVPQLAVSWEVSEDGLQWTFHLRQGVKFHDGTTLTAEDVKASIERIINPKYGLGRRATLNMIQRVDVKDEYTAVVVTAYPFAPLLYHLSMDVAAIMSKAALDKYGYETKDIGWRPVGTGPFRYESHVPEESITLVRFEEYWGPRPYLDKIIFRCIPEAATRVVLLETGALDIIEMVPPHEMERLARNPDLVTFALPGNRVAHIGMNCQRPPFNDPRVRQAMNYAIDKQSLIEGLLLGFARPADSIVAPGVVGHHSVPMYTYDPQRAKALLAEAGYPNGFSFTLWTPSGRYFMDKETVVAIQAQLREIGLNANIRVIDWTTYLSLLRKPLPESETEVYFLAWEVGTDDIAYLLDLVFSSAAWPPGWNTMFYKNDEVDRLIQEGKSTLDPDVRQQIYARLQELIMADAPWVPLFVYDQLFAARKNVHNFWVWTSGTVILREVWKG